METLTKMKNEWHKKIFYIETDGFKYKEYILMYRMSQKMLLLSGFDFLDAIASL